MQYVPTEKTTLIAVAADGATGIVRDLKTTIFTVV
jgi:hypothetical protein